MKKFLKLLLALIIIAGIAVGAYFIFNQKHNNDQIYAKVYGLNNSLAYTNSKNENINLYTAVNQNVFAMNEDLTNLFNGQVPEIKTYFETFLEAQSIYFYHEQQILSFGLYINQENSKCQVFNPQYSTFW